MLLKSISKIGIVLILLTLSSSVFGIKIGLLEILGNNTITREEIVENLTKCTEGNDVTPADIDYDKFMLTDMGYFSEVKSRVTDYVGDTKILTFEVVEYPTVNEIELKILGPSLIKKFELEKLIKVETSKALNLKNLVKTQNSIKNMFVANDYEMIQIQNNLQKEEYGYYLPESKLTIEVKELAINDIILEGELGDITYKEVKELLNLRLLVDYYKEFFKLFLIKKNYYPKTSDLQMALSRLLQSPLIGSETSFDIKPLDEQLEEGEYAVDLILKIKLNHIVPEGKPINSITTSGNTVLSSEKIIEMTKSKNDSSLVLMHVLRDMQNIKKLFEEYGYPYILVNPKYDIKTGNLNFKITEAEIREVKLEGLKKTREDLVWKHVRLVLNEPIKYSDIKQTYINLNKTGFFNEINIEPIGFSEYSTATTIIIKLSESRENISIKSGATFDPRNTGENLLQKIYGTLNLGLINPVGLGQNINLDATMGKRPKITLSYNIPSVFSSPFDAGVSFNYNQDLQFKDVKTSDSSTKVNFTNENFSIAPNLTYHIDDFQSINTSFTWGKFKRFEFDTEATALLNQIKKEGDIGVLGVSYTFDTRDDELDPTEGFRFNLRGEYSLPFASEEWFNLYESVSVFYPIMPDHVLAGRIFMAQNLFDPEGVSNFSMRGPNNSFVRALSFANPGDIGDYAFAINGEYRFKAVKEKSFSVTFLGFTDIGYAFSNSGEMSWNNLNATFGVGARLQIPGFGLFRFDLGLDVSPETFKEYGSPQFGFSFGIGHRF